MLTGPDHLVVLYVPCDGTQDDLLHNLPRHRGSYDSRIAKERCFSPLTIFVVLFWTCSNRSMSFLYWGPQNHMQYSIQPRIRLAFWAASTHCGLTSNFSSTSTPKSFCTGLLSIHSFPSLLTLGIALTQVQDLALGLVELHGVRMGPLLKPVKVPLDGIPSLKRINCTTQLGLICKLAEGALNPTVYVINKDIEQYWVQYGPLRSTTCYCSPFAYSFIHQCSHSIVEGHQFSHIGLSK
ncbi:hypothetical protein QYF61_013047, partial [Mycteria americana]